MKRKISIFILFFLIIGVLYAEITMATFHYWIARIEAALNNVFPGIPVDVVFFLPLILVDIVIGFVYGKYSKMIKKGHLLTYYFRWGLYLLFAILLSEIGFFGWSTAKIVVLMKDF